VKFGVTLGNANTCKFFFFYCFRKEKDKFKSKHMTYQPGNGKIGDVLLKDANFRKIPLKV